MELLENGKHRSGHGLGDFGVDDDVLQLLEEGEPLAGDAWAIRVYVKPFVRWIWLGGLMIGFGGLLAVFDRRYRRRKVTSTKKVTVTKTGVTEATQPNTEAELASGIN